MLENYPQTLAIAQEISDKVGELQGSTILGKFSGYQSAVVEVDNSCGRCDSLPQRAS
ncbi:hypothetical protein NDI37_24380 [Funiculus sociatus GB2-A5]|uniref:Uncharacterized protein n=1 Tax=Funiculus sociatus GB2-A5 TaxID=2933946 RepID=A0ABV0JVV5_9CYAN|nr:hypothetical protein [Trichocoleus sp. FACHB-832]MBD2062847.1 hypothetical protein [Trichocoleus sp. FACHB-6]